MKILVVDDEPQLRTLLADLLEEEGWSVLTASQGKEALDLLTKEQIDLVVCDIYMPIMNGLRLRDNVREDPKLKDIPFLFVSGYDDQMTLGAVHSPKIEGFIQKGKPPNQIKAWIRYLTTPIDKRIGLSPGDRSWSR